MPALLRLFLLLALCAAGCTGPGPAPTGTLIAPELRFATPPPRALGYAIEVRQLVTARYRDEGYTFEGVLSVTPERLRIVNLDPFGRRALSIERDDEHLSYQREPFVPAALDPANVVADIALIYWPEEAVRAGLAGTGAEVETTERRRRVTRGGRDIVEIEYEKGWEHAWEGGVRYRNAAFGYELSLRSSVIAR